jgi:hypothetical protein
MIMDHDQRRATTLAINPENLKVGISQKPDGGLRGAT